MSEGARWASRLSQALKTSSMVIGGIIASLFLYAAVGLIGLRSGGRAELAGQTKLSVYAVALFLAMGSIAIRRTQFRLIRLQSIAVVRGSTGLINHLMRTTVISAMMADIIGLLGLVLCFTGGTAADILYTGGVALIVAVSTFPRRRAWERTIEYFDENGIAADSAAAS